MKDESAVWQQFSKHLPYRMFRRRIEDEQNLGTWDVALSMNGVGTWIELKHTATVNTKPKLRKGQYAFGLDLIKSGTMGCYVVGSKDGKVRVLCRTYDGEDWKKSIIYQYDTMNKDTVLEILEYCGINHSIKTENDGG